MSTRRSQYISRKHQLFRLPVELQDLEGKNLPLYILIALWGLRKREPLTVKDVRHGFGLSIRRASDILEYMTEQGDKVVEVICYLRPMKSGDRRMRREWIVTAVHGERLRCSVNPVNIITEPSFKHPISQPDSICELRRWFVGRRQGMTIPDELIVQE